MNTKPLEQLKQLFVQQNCWTIQQLDQAMDYSIISIRRFLKEIGYYSSFTHNSKWYTLDTIPSFDKNGIWFHGEIGFSKHGNLKQNIIYFVNRSRQGLTANQVADILSIPCHAVLTHMYKSKTIDRFKGRGTYVYISSIPKRRMQQLRHLQTCPSIAGQVQKLSAHSAVYVLIEYIKRPEATFEELSKAVAKNQIMATPEMIACFFKEHDLKKTSL